MNGNRWLDRLSQHERLNFLLTNRIPRRYATLFMGWFSRIEQPLVRAPVVRGVAGVRRRLAPARSGADATSRACTSASRAA